MRTYILEEDTSMVLDLARQLTDAEIRSLSESVDHEELFPQKGLSILAESELVACNVSEKYGGAGLDALATTVIIEEIAKGCASTAAVLANIAVSAEMIEKYATEDVKKDLLVSLISGRYACVVGSDGEIHASFKSTLNLQHQDGKFVLNGSKKYVPNASDQGIYIVAANMDDTIKWMIINGNTQGVKIQKNSSMLGFKGMPLDTFIFEDVVVDEKMFLSEDILDEKNGLEALYTAAIASGIAQGSLQEAIVYVNQREQFKKTIAQFENTQQVLAELLAKAEAARALVWDAARVKSAGEDYIYAADMAKIVAADTANVTSRKCLQFMGGYGYSRDYPIERKMRDAKMTEVIGGAALELKNHIAGKAVVMLGK